MPRSYTKQMDGKMVMFTPGKGGSLTYHQKPFERPFGGMLDSAVKRRAKIISAPGYTGGGIGRTNFANAKSMLSPDLKKQDLAMKKKKRRGIVAALSEEE